MYLYRVPVFTSSWRLLHDILTPPPNSYFFFFNDTATTEIYTLSLHDALPISHEYRARSPSPGAANLIVRSGGVPQSRFHCRGAIAKRGRRSVSGQGLRSRSSRSRRK